MVLTWQNSDRTKASIMVRGNFSLDADGLVSLLLALAAVSLGLAVLLALQGYWPILLIAAVQLALVAWILIRAWARAWVSDVIDISADKITVTTALIILLNIDRIPAWATSLVVVIIGRELAVTGLRGIASAGGQVVAATWPGKVKALVQNVAIGALLFPDPTLGLPAHRIGLVLLGAATALTLWSGYVYFADYFGADSSASAEQPPPEENIV